ncbi:MAG: trans-4-hydroxy-L-proline dehydratase [Anaerolineae bacterium]|jgi:pyruvate formate-lyase/glycerol dehydratase family glycyl radical enzyme
MPTDRVNRLRQRSYKARPTISTERAGLMTAFYREHLGKHSTPVLRALAFQHLCAHKTVYVGADELIVGERGPAPKATPTYPELTCHSADDLRILNSRPKTAYGVSDGDLALYEQEIIPCWQGRSMRERIFAQMSPEWLACYEAGMFTEFMEQRAPGHTVLDDKIYRRGLLDLKADIAAALAALDGAAADQREQLRAMDIACDAVILYAERHADLAERLAAAEGDATRRAELLQIARVCRWVPAHAPRTFWEALQTYWFVHLGVITELNGWDAFNPGHLDQHLGPFYEADIASGALTREDAKELLSCFWIKFNNQPAPPKVGVTAAESGTYNDFANINIGGMDVQGRDAVNEVSYLLLEIIPELHLLQPGSNIQLSAVNPDEFIRAACRVIRHGYGYPSVFNADMVVQEQLRVGKTLADARQGGTSGCVETGCFGKEAYILTGYLNLPKVLELTLNNGRDPRTGRQLGPQTGEPSGLATFEQLYAAYEAQLAHVIGIKLVGNDLIERLYAEQMPAPFLSAITDDCIARGLDYHAGGARYNTSYIQGVGIGSITDSLSAIKTHVYDQATVTMAELTAALAGDFGGHEPLRQQLANRSPRYGNDHDAADALMQRVFESFYRLVEGRPNLRGGSYHIDMLPTTCHIYFGSVMGASADGRLAGRPLSEGISPVQGADRRGPTAVARSAAKMDHVRTGGTLLNMKFQPHVLANEEGIANLAALIRGYFGMGGHHVQFNVVDAATLRAAQARPEEHRGLMVRVAGYSDYFCDLSRELQEEIIERTAQSGF